MSDCLFCSIAAGEIPSDKVYEDDNVLAFKDIAPKAPIHILVIPKKHIQSAAMVNSGNSVLVAQCFEAIAAIAGKMGIDNFQVLTNCGEEAGQTVPHLHFHLLAQRSGDLTEK
ncbi:MAG: histidine triad nucleotide-binding protein [Oscillospiraceae bacterium]|nr:histidine triad nucleotide-binding protein [Oscillospiraceae bacterium]